MKLKSMRLKNFLSFGSEAQELLFGDLSEIFIVGPNDSGKSNIFRSLNFVREAVENSYPPKTFAEYLPSSKRDFEVTVGLELDAEEIQALQDFLVCANMSYQFSGGSSDTALSEVKNEILRSYGDKLFADLGREITISVEGSEKEGLPSVNFVKIRLGSEDFLITRDSYIAKVRTPVSQAFGYVDFNVVLMDDFKSRYAKEYEQLKPDWESLDDFYKSPDMGLLLFSRLPTSHVSKPRQTPLTGIQVQALNIGEFTRRFGVPDRLQRLTTFLNKKGFFGDTLSLKEFFTAIYAHSIIWVSDMRGRPPNHTPVAWTKTIQTQQINYPRQSLSRIRRFGTETLPITLFELLTSTNAVDQRRYDEIQREFKKFTDGTSFRVYLEDREVDSEGPQAANLESDTLQSESLISGTSAGDTRRSVKVISLQMFDESSSWPVILASAGVIEVLLLLTALIGTENRIMLFDEPAQNMHPDFQRRFMDLLRRHNRDNHNQALVITHSPFLLARENLSNVWRLTKEKGKGTVPVSVSGALEKLDLKSKEKISQQLDSADVRSTLFSRGAVFVEGLTDKWVVQEFDKRQSSQGVGVNLLREEWTLVSMNGSGNSPIFLRLAQLFHLRYAFILDRDAESIVRRILSDFGIEQADDTIMKVNGFFLLKTDMDDVVGISGSEQKPLRAIDQVLEGSLETIKFTELDSCLEFLKQRVMA